ncbi:FAD-dependent oxidoreductase [Streptomyces griseocarneus]|uniref:FAD-dependent oxidoreductase n=1 Tax=Streptomyces griseocarneus TaxID=51201 RepID=UPI00167E2FCA|nr:FAD-dependent oxidoreductase [Streptomyces griseocarneus]MBZ6472373.1 FAD-dependent oxidoreductase [Streptomyces griseocarneus]GHG44819.1 monooxygenase [Streptomyces griseocarneus]
MDPVIVVGAGPVGLTLALALARYEVPVTVLDESPAEALGQEDGRLARTAVLRPETAALLDRLGCATPEGARWSAWRTMRRRSVVTRVSFAAPGGVVNSGEPEGYEEAGESREPGELEMFEAAGEDGAAGASGDDATTGGAAEPSPLHLPQHALTRELCAALAKEADVRIVRDSRLTIVKQDSSGVTVHTRGDNGTVWRASYVIGCDGARSVVRKLLGARFPGRTAVERHAVAALRVELPWPGEAVLHRSPPRGREVTARPLPDGVWRLDWLLPPDGGLVTPDALLEHVRDALSVWCGEVPAYDLLDTGVHAVHHRLARRWRSGRAFLAGDAAHLLGALGAQGLDEGLRDAENLAWKLALAWHHGASDALLDSYQAERRGAVAERLRAADRALPAVRAEGGWHSVRRTVVPGAVRGHDTLLTDGHLGRGTQAAPPVYARTPLLPAAPPASSVLVGTDVGAPVTDVPVTAPDGSEVWLRDRLGGDLLVVLVAPGTGVWERRHWLGAGLMPRLAAAVSALPMRAELLVAEGYPGAAAHTVLVVRPDGHLVAALEGVRPAELYACADAARGGAREAARAPGVAEGTPDEATSEATANR